MSSKKAYVDKALSLLGIERLALAIHDQSFPSLPAEETGRGSPYSPGGRKFVQFISDLGFNAVQLGPQGRTALGNPSPYDSTLFSKNELSISVHSLGEDALTKSITAPAVVKSTTVGCPSMTASRNMTSYEFAWRTQQKVLREIYEAFKSGQDAALQTAYEDWCKKQTEWSSRDALYEALVAEYGADDWHQWSTSDQDLGTDFSKAGSPAAKRADELLKKHADVVDFFMFCQFLVHRQHEQLRELTTKLQVRLYADMQIGFSQRDTWALRPFFIPGYLLGAPPSRTNPNGQPWGYPVLNPDLYGTGTTAENIKPGPALNLLRSRVYKLLQDFDGLRIDHPHGLVCPWMYKSDEPDALWAVQNGARLFESPNNKNHPQLAKHAIAKEEQLAGPDSGIPPYADGWVRELTDEQIARYAILIDTIRAQMEEFKRDPSDLVSEVLSSCPFPLQSVLRKNGMGRFRVTQKAQPLDPNDVYRSANAQPPDWIMLGTHDTKPVWLVVEQMSESDRSNWVQYLTERLEPNPDARDSFAAQLKQDNGRLVEAMFADLFVGPAKNISVFFSDLFGIKTEYNAPGVISDTNWVLSVPNDYERSYMDNAAKRQALNIPRALAMAIRARGLTTPEARELMARLDEAVTV